MNDLNNSEFDENKNVVSALIKDSTWKPLVNDLLNFNTNLYWILPVAKNVKKLYDVVAIEGMSYPNIDILSENNDLLEMTNIIKNYKSSDAPDEVNKYITLIEQGDILWDGCLTEYYTFEYNLIPIEYMVGAKFNYNNSNGFISQAVLYLSISTNK